MKKNLLTLFYIFCFYTLVYSQQNGYRQGCYNTIWPADMANLNRTGCVVNAGLPQGFNTSQVAITSINLPFPIFTYTRDTNEIFVLGGAPYLLDTYDKVIETGSAPAPNFSYYYTFTPYLAKYNPTTNSVVQTTLAGGSGSPYVGGALIHSNGLVYAVAKGRLFKINPATMGVLGFVDLPIVGSASQTNYNGLTVTSNGRLISKAFGSTNGAFVLVDQNSLSILHQITIPNGSPRLCMNKESNGKLYLYHLTQTQTFRLQIRNDSLIQDASWTAAYNPYNNGSTAEPLSPVIFDQKVVYTTNTVYTATTATKFFWQKTNQSYSYLTDTLKGYYPTNDSITIGYSFFHLNVDDTISKTIIINDQGAHRICAVKLIGNVFTKIWSKPYVTSAKPAIVADRGLLYINDFNLGNDYLVVLDLLTGTELYRIQTPAIHPTIATIIVGTKNDVYYSSNEPYNAQGYLHRIYYTGSTTSLNKNKTENDIKIYPNPTSDKLFIQSDVELTNYSLKIINEQGKTILYQPTIVSKEVSLSNLNSGNYIMQLQSKTNTINHKLIIK